MRPHQPLRHFRCSQRRRILHRSDGKTPAGTRDRAEGPGRPGQDLRCGQEPSRTGPLPPEPGSRTLGHRVASIGRPHGETPAREHRRGWQSLCVIECLTRRQEWVLFRGTEYPFHETRSTSDVLPGGAPGARTLNPRIKRGPLRRYERSACTDIPSACPESTQCTAMPPMLVPRAVPRRRCRAWRIRSLNVATRCPAAWQQQSCTGPATVRQGFANVGATLWQWRCCRTVPEGTRSAGRFR